MEPLGSAAVGSIIAFYSVPVSGINRQESGGRMTSGEAEGYPENGSNFVTCFRIGLV